MHFPSAPRSSEPRRPTVLVVDDDEDHAVMLSFALSREGYATLTAGSCAEAHEILGETQVDALVADFSLGDGDAASLLRSLEHGRPRTCVVLSGFDADEIERRAGDVVFDAHLVKPAAIDDVVGALARRRPVVGGPIGLPKKTLLPPLAQIKTA